MVTKASNSVLNLVNPPIDDMVLLSGTLDDVVIGSHVPNEAFFTDLTDTWLRRSWVRRLVCSAGSIWALASP
jgi:hypothetical protein